MRKLITSLILILIVVSALIAGNPEMKPNEESMTDYRNIAFNTITGTETRLADFDGKVVVIVNVASKCGFTPQYKDMEASYRANKDRGLVILGFPANNFGSQEPGTDMEILDFCTSNFDVTFPMMSKVSVKGDDIHPLFKYLTEESDYKGEIPWNFHKFIIDRKGNVAGRFNPDIKPQDEPMVGLVEKLLEEK